MFCEKCNENYPETAVFCPQCGSKLTEETSIREDESDIIKESEIEIKEDASLNNVSEEEAKNQTFGGIKIDLDSSEGSYTAPNAESDYVSFDSKESYADINGKDYKTSFNFEDREMPERKVSKFSEYFNDKKNCKKFFLLVLGIILIVIGIIAVPSIYNNVSYGKAVRLFESGEYYSAEDKFIPLAKKDYKYSDDYLNYIYGMQAFEAKDYEDADDYFDEVNPYMIGKSDEYNNYIDYIEALEAYDDGEYYTAYNLFNRISQFEDAGEMAEKCVKDRLESKVISVKSEYKGSSKLEIKIPKGAYDAYVKVFDSSNNEVASLYVRDGESVSFDLRSGTYKIKATRGDKWFGEKEMFGGSLIDITIDGNKIFNVGKDEIVTVTLK